MTALWSLNEIEALARKAARGAGFEWGLTEEAGQAVRWLEARGLPGAKALEFALNAGVLDDAGRCAISLGCAICDGAVTPVSLSSRDVIAPLLLLPFASWWSEQHKQSLTLSWPDGAIDIEGACFAIGPAGVTVPPRADIAFIDRKARGLTQVNVGFRAQVDCETYVALSAFAQRTYAPSTEVSRLSGAGAGLSDND